MHQLRILFLEPFYGGSHREFADGLVRYSRHSVILKTLPARFWKWRMRGAALHFVHTIDDWNSYDLVLMSDLMSASDLKALAPAGLPPIAVYFHESQLSYPLPPGEKIDYQFGFTDITTGLAADGLIFNSRFHHDLFFEELPRFIRRMPEFKPRWAAEAIQKKSTVIYPGCELPTVTGSPGRNRTPIILWNHRWEFDKDPESFFRVLDELDDTGAEFNLALLGENFQTVPKPFLAARERYGSRILVYGFQESRADYYRWLQQSDIVVSTSIQENFGLSVVEATAAGAYPLLPERLAYPEVLPDAFHTNHLYRDEAELAEKLQALLNEGVPAVPELQQAMLVHSWDRRIREYDEYFSALAEKAKSRIV